MLSIALAMAITVIAAAGTLSIYGTVRDKIAHERVYHDVQTIQKAVLAAYANTNQLLNITDAMLQSLDSFSDGQRTSSGDIKSSERYGIHIAGGHYNCTDCANSLRIAIDDVDHDLCTKMTTWSFSSNQPYLEIGTRPGNRTRYVRPFDAAAARNRCKSFPEPLSIVFGFIR